MLRTIGKRSTDLFIWVGFVFLLLFLFFFFALFFFLLVLFLFLFFFFRFRFGSFVYFFFFLFIIRLIFLVSPKNFEVIGNVCFRPINELRHFRVLRSESLA